MYCFNFGFNKKFICILGLLVVLCLSMSMVNATAIYCNGSDSSIHLDKYYQGNSLVYSFNVHSETDLKNVLSYLESADKVPNRVIINLLEDIKFSDSKLIPINSQNIISINSKNIIFEINGNDHSIKVSNPSDRAENHFLTCGSKAHIFIKNLTLSGFNTAIINRGNLNLKDVTFDSNYLEYWFDRDDGGAIFSVGNLTCDNCNFTDNYAKEGGAIYLGSSSKSFTQLNNCYFYRNHAYGDSSGDDIDFTGLTGWDALLGNDIDLKKYHISINGIDLKDYHGNDIKINTHKKS